MTDYLLPPQNVQAEESVLGAILIDPDALDKIQDILTADDFYQESNGWIYKACCDLSAGGAAIDFITITGLLELRSQLADLGGAARVNELIAACPSALNIVDYARLVRHASLLRALNRASREIAKASYDTETPIQEVLDKAEAQLLAVTGRQTTGSVVPIQKAVSDYYDRIDYITKNGITPGIPTKLEGLDKILGGLQRSDLIIVAGRPGMGKTSLMLNMVANAPQAKSMIFSLEMSAEQLVQRMISTESGVDSQRLRLGKLKEEEWPLFIQFSEELSRRDIFIDDTPSASAMQIRAKARKIYAEYGLDLIIVDYLQLMQAATPFRNRVQEISLLSRLLKGLARELNIPVVVGSQLSRACEQRDDKHPILSDLRESGSIEQDADVVIFLYRDDYYKPDTDIPNIAEAHVAKHRNGPTGMESLYFDKTRTRFASVQLERKDLVF
jgi:replicative DNA helicase